MLKQYTIIGYLVLLNISITYAQESINSMGNSYANQEISITMTVGEVAINTFSNEKAQLTQGFQQPKIVIEDIVSGITKSDDELLINIYPNPSSKYITIDAGEDMEIIAEITDAQSRLVHRSLISKHHKTIDMSGLPDGTYVLQLKNLPKQFFKSYKILKSN